MKLVCKVMIKAKRADGQPVDVMAFDLGEVGKEVMTVFAFDDVIVLSRLPMKTSVMEREVHDWGALEAAGLDVSERDVVYVGEQS